MVDTVLLKFDSTQLNELGTWVDSKDQMREWAGPNVRYPCSAYTLEKDLFSKGWPSYALTTVDNQLLGFGQYYSRQNHCHLCRLIIAPSQRGKGFAAALIEQISLAASHALGLKTSSLFVYTANHAAIKAYKKIGFKVTNYPGDDSIENCIYMVKS